MRIVTIGLLVLSLGCAHTNTPKLKSYFFKRPPNTWFSRPVPCPFTEVGRIVVQEWEYNDVVTYIDKLTETVAIDAIIDFTIEKDIAAMPQTNAAGSPSETQYRPYWRGAGLAVKWADPSCIPGDQ